MKIYKNVYLSFLRRILGGGDNGGLLHVVLT